MCKLVDITAHQRWRCEEAYRIAKKLCRVNDITELSKEEKYDLEYIKDDSTLDPPQTKWWLGAARQSAERLYKKEGNTYETCND